MPTLLVEPELYERVEHAAQTHHTNPNDILAQALRAYLWELDCRKISEESAIYRQQHVIFKLQYLGQYIALHDGQVVGHDADYVALRQRICAQFGHEPVMITLVEEAPEPALTRHNLQIQK